MSIPKLLSQPPLLHAFAIYILNQDLKDVYISLPVSSSLIASFQRRFEKVYICHKHVRRQILATAAHPRYQQRRRITLSQRATSLCVFFCFFTMTITHLIVFIFPRGALWRYSFISALLSHPPLFSWQDDKDKVLLGPSETADVIRFIHAILS